jgi:hypothetical protein
VDRLPSDATLDLVSVDASCLSGVCFRAVRGLDTRLAVARILHRARVENLTASIALTFDL